jgi:hypothetical protein
VSFFVPSPDQGKKINEYTNKQANKRNAEARGFTLAFLDGL